MSFRNAFLHFLHRKVISRVLASLCVWFSAWHSAQSYHCLQHGARMETCAFSTCLLCIASDYQSPKVAVSLSILTTYALINGDVIKILNRNDYWRQRSRSHSRIFTAAGLTRRTRTASESESVITGITQPPFYHWHLKLEY